MTLVLVQMGVVQVQMGVVQMGVVQLGVVQLGVVQTGVDLELVPPNKKKMTEYTGATQDRKKNQVLTTNFQKENKVHT